MNGSKTSQIYCVKYAMQKKEKTCMSIMKTMNHSLQYMGRKSHKVPS